MAEERDLYSSESDDIALNLIRLKLNKLYRATLLVYINIKKNRSFNDDVVEGEDILNVGNYRESGYLFRSSVIRAFLFFFWAS